MAIYVENVENQALFIFDRIFFNSYNSPIGMKFEILNLFYRNI